MSVADKLLQAAAGNAGEVVYVDDLFSTYVYEGNGSTGQTITNGIDLDGEGGLVWIKSRSSTQSNELADTERGRTKFLRTNSNGLERTSSSGDITSFNSSGFSVGQPVTAGVNSNGTEYCSWTFRKQKKFFDIVEYTGNGTAGTEIAHNLGSTPGMIVVKALGPTYGGSWRVWHRSVSTSVLRLDQTAGISAIGNPQNTWGDNSSVIQPTSTHFTIGSETDVNRSSTEYIAYIFAHDEQDFGTGSNESIIKCGSITLSSYADIVEELGWEPQWLLIKNTSTSENWFLMDTMRGWVNTTSNDDRYLNPNLSSAEASANKGRPTATGFGTNGGFTAGGNTHIYVAIRRPHKPASEFAATDLFAIDTKGGTSPTPPAYVAGFPVDMALHKNVSSTGDWRAQTRLTQGTYLETNNTDAQVTDANMAAFDFQNGYRDATGTTSSSYAWMWRRAKGYFDVVTYTGDNTTNQQVSHNLGVAPELMILKLRNSIGAWAVYSAPTTEAGFLMLHNTAAYQTGSYWGTSGGTAPTATTITVDGSGNNSGTDYILYLFASVDGISKVGSYTGSGSTQTIDCGFSNGARFVLIKCTSGSSNWFLWDSERGITSGLDNYILLNSTAAQTTNSPVDVNPASSGFEVFGNDSDSNRSGETYLFYAIA
jgi:hypothetical protein